MRNTKKCSKCKEVKPLGEFHKNRTMSDGCQNYCKPCHLKSRNWNYHREYIRKYRRTSEGGTVTRTAVYKYRSRNPHKSAAHTALKGAISSGKVVRLETCSECGEEGVMDGHHADYGKPLDVIWLCRRCHKLLHREEVAV